MRHQNDGFETVTRRKSRDSERVEAIAKIQELLAENPLTQADIFPTELAAKAGESTSTKNKILKKYRDVESGKERSGLSAKMAARQEQGRLPDRSTNSICHKSPPLSRLFLCLAYAGCKKIVLSLLTSGVKLGQQIRYASFVPRAMARHAYEVKGISLYKTFSLP